MISPSPALFLVMISALAAPAAALAPQTESFLKELGIDVKAAGVVAVAADSVSAESGEVYTLDSLAAKRDENGVKSFLVTRGFLYDFRNDPDSQFPDDALYNILYLSIADRTYIAKTLMANFPKAAGSAPALSAEAAAFIKSIGLDPASAEVTLARADGEIRSVYRGHPVSNSLDALVKAGSTKGVFSFVTTRVFIRKLKADFKVTDVPKAGYDGIYLTGDERLIVADKLVERATKD